MHHLGERIDKVNDKCTAFFAESLALHAEACFRMSTVYLWGGLGHEITETVIKRKREEDPTHYPIVQCRKLKKMANNNIYGFDCSGLIKNYLMGGPDNFRYRSEYDLNSSAMFNLSKVKGKMKTLPEYRGICLYMPGHVGIYVGCGNVIEATNNPSFGDGVVMTKITDREWTDWFCCPYVEYPDFPETEGKEYTI